MGLSGARSILLTFLKPQDDNKITQGNAPEKEIILTGDIIAENQQISIAQLSR
jgi:hypothetical protein